MPAARKAISRRTQRLYIPHVMAHDPRTEAAREPVRVRFRFFARYAELVGTETHDLAIPAGTTVGAAVGTLREQLPGARALPDAPLAAVNLHHVDAAHVLMDGDELALLPPLAGG
jgi:molybdopterin synthase catalytic subunit